MTEKQKKWVQSIKDRTEARLSVEKYLKKNGQKLECSRCGRDLPGNGVCTHCEYEMRHTL